MKDDIKGVKNDDTKDEIKKWNNEAVNQRF